MKMLKSDCRALYDLQLTTGMDFVYGPEAKKAHSEAIEKDKDKSYRIVVNIVGKERQGKTSLRRLLVGEDFNKSEESTVGIDHELVETLGTSPTNGKVWSKVDLKKANDDECNTIVCKHVRQRLKKNQQERKNNAEIQSFMKVTILSYVMLFLYFTAAESDLSQLPWVSAMLIVSFAFSGLVLFDSIRDGFGMTLGVLCLVVYSDSFLRWKVYEEYVHLDRYMESYALLIWSFVHAFIFYCLIHVVIGLKMGLSMAMGFCFVLCIMQPPWNRQMLKHSVFTELHLHVFTMVILFSIWTLRKPKFVAITFIVLTMASYIIPTSYLLTIASGLGVGYGHVIFIKIGFDTYLKLLNPLLKRIANGRLTHRLICYGLGVIPGIFVAHILEWTLSKVWYIDALFGLIVIAFVELCHIFLEGRIDADPKATFRNASKVLESESEASLKFVIRDFAGHPLYHSIHHIYMMGHCIYVVVFNIMEAKRNFKYSFGEILYWLQAIFVHGRFPSVRAFIVGTHRDDKSLSKKDIKQVSDKIMENLPRQFYNMVVWNKHTDRPVFHVENSVRDIYDRDHAYLKEQLLNLAEHSNRMQYPIRYLYFYRMINDCRAKGRLIETLDSVERMCSEYECKLTEDGELEDLLNYFNDCGEIIYNSCDNVQNQLVVMDPKALVDIMTSLIQAPPRAERESKFVLAWNTVVEHGIATQKLLYHIIENSPLVSKDVNVQLVLTLLENLDLVCRLHVGYKGETTTGDKCYLLIPLLKDTLPYPQNYWKDVKSDTVLYVDFGSAVPKFIFTRLICQCSSEAHVDIGLDGSFHLNVCTSKALFTFRPSNEHSQSLKIELLDISESASPTQQLLKIAIRGCQNNGCAELTRRLCQKISNIVERNFQKCRYKIGVMCPFEGPHEYCQGVSLF